MNRAGIPQEAGRGVEEIQQDVHGDLGRDELVLRVVTNSLRIVGQQAGLHVAPDERLSLHSSEEPQHGDRERDVKLDPQRWGGDHERADRRRVVVHPQGGKDGADTLGDHRHVLDGDVVRLRYGSYELIGVLHHLAEAVRVSTIAGGSPVATRIPGETPVVVETEPVDDVLPSRGMLVAAVKEHDGPVARGARGPGAVEQLGPVPQRDRMLRGSARRDRLFGHCPALPEAALRLHEDAGDMLSAAGAGRQICPCPPPACRAAPPVHARTTPHKGASHSILPCSSSRSSIRRAISSGNGEVRRVRRFAWEKRSSMVAAIRPVVSLTMKCST